MSRPSSPTETPNSIESEMPEFESSSYATDHLAKTEKELEIYEKDIAGPIFDQLEQLALAKEGVYFDSVDDRQFLGIVLEESDNFVIGIEKNKTTNQFTLGTLENGLFEPATTQEFHAYADVITKTARSLIDNVRRYRYERKQDIFGLLEHNFQNETPGFSSRILYNELDEECRFIGVSEAENPDSTLGILHNLDNGSYDLCRNNEGKSALESFECIEELESQINALIEPPFVSLEYEDLGEEISEHQSVANWMFNRLGDLSEAGSQNVFQSDSENGNFYGIRDGDEFFGILNDRGIFYITKIGGGIMERIEPRFYNGEIEWLDQQIGILEENHRETDSPTASLDGLSATLEDGIDHIEEVEDSTPAAPPSSTTTRATSSQLEQGARFSTLQ